VDERLNFIAIRRIEKGEELTVRYADFSDPPGEARDSGD
jgi:SET domain-containing protein